MLTSPTVLLKSTLGVKGSGAFVGSYLLSCHHVIYNGDDNMFSALDYLFHNDEGASQALPTDNPKELPADGLFFDFALYKLPTRINDLVFADTLPTIGQQLKLYLNRNNTILPIEATVNGVVGNFFSCHLAKSANLGECGSPLIADNKVWGIMNFGPDSDNSSDEILFLATAPVIDFVRTNYPDFL